MLAFFISAVFSVSTVWVAALVSLSGYGWPIGAMLGGLLHCMVVRRKVGIVAHAA